MGVRGISVSDDDEVVVMQKYCDGECMLFITEKGMGKRTAVSEFPLHHRGGKGVISYKLNDKTGDVAAAIAVNEQDDVMIINTEGIIIRIECEGISKLGRATSGVKMIQLSDDIQVASIARIRAEIKEREGDNPENSVDNNDAAEDEQ